MLPNRLSDLPELRAGKAHMQFLFGLASGGVYHAIDIATNAVRSYRTLSALPDKSGGLLSVALSVGSRHPAVSRHRFSMKPGLSSSVTRLPNLLRLGICLIGLKKANFDSGNDSHTEK